MVPVLRRLVALVLVERLDLADGAGPPVRPHSPSDELRAVHFVLDTKVANELEDNGPASGWTRFPLDVIECPDRRLTRGGDGAGCRGSGDGQTEVSVLLPRRVFEGAVAPGAARPDR